MNIPRNKLMIIVLMSGAFLGSLSQNMLTSALPAIIEEFAINDLLGQWLTTIYLLILGVITVLTAALFQRINTKLLLEISLLTFACGCLIALFAQSFLVLLAARAIQAFGAGVLIPVLQMVLIHIYPPEKQGLALGISGIVIGFAPAAGPALSGILIDALGWRSIFFILSAASLAVAAVGSFTFYQVAPLSRPPLHLGFAMIYGIGFILIMLSITQLGNAAFSPFYSIFSLAAGAAILFFFFKAQLHNSKALLNLTVFKNCSMRTGTLLMIITYSIMSAGTILVPIYIQSICGYSATLSGLALFPGSLLLAFLSPLAGHLSDHFGIRKIIIAGFILLMLGMGIFGFVSTGTSLTVISIIYSIGHIGLAFLLMPLTAYAISGLLPLEADQALAILNSLRQIGGSLFAAMLVLTATVFSAASNMDLTGFRSAGLTSAGLLLICLIFWFKQKQKLS